MKTKKDTPRDLREECVQQALAIIAGGGIDTLSLRDVARRLGVSHQAPYKHFPSREHILAEVLQARMRGHAPDVALRNLGLAYLAYARDNPLHYQLMFATPLPDPDEHPEMMEEARRAFGILREALAALPHHDDKDITRDALFVWSTMHGLASIMKTRLGHQMGLTDAAIPQTSRHVLDMIGRALGNADE